MLPDLTVALFVAYAALGIWRLSVGMPEGYEVHALLFGVLLGVARGLERGANAGRVQRTVAYLARLDPEVAQQEIGRMWSARARQLYRELLREEGEVEEARGVERFPYPASEHRLSDQLFWVTVVLAAGVFGVLLFTRVRVGGAAPWLIWTAGTGLVVVAGLARRRSRELGSTLELSPFGITYEASDGSRQTIRWKQDLVIQNQPKKRRVVLATADRKNGIALHYRRLGFERLLRLTIERGGFQVVAADPAADDPPA